MSSDLLGSKYLSIDLGINNFSTCVSEHKSFILNGKVMKSVNQYYNKKTAEFRSIRDGQKSFCLYKTKLRRLLCYRNDFIKDVLHKYSRAIIRFCLNYKIGNIVVGYNKAWKTQLCLGRVTNQNFQGLPFQKFISYLKYKSDLVGINLIEQEESYTSKCDSLAMESVEHHDKYIGKRIKRGLFQSAIGKTINADVNGSFNTLRKVIGDSDDQIHRIINSGFLFNPVKIRMNDLSNFYKERVSHTLCD
jgi:IS605 OrfB family transposase